MKKLNIKLYSITSFLLLATLFSGIILSSTTAKADDSTADSVSISINTACTITTGGGEYSETIDPNTSKTIVGNGINVSCNDSGGYALYAIGFSGDSYDAPNNNRMLGPNSQYIPTANSGSDSYWAMKAAGSSTTSNVPTIDNSYSDFQIIPATYTKISHYSSVTVGTTDNSVTTPTYKVNVSAAQPVGTYVGKVKYTIVHPSTAPAPSTKLYMQDLTLADCQSSASSDNLTVTDRRDENDYTVKYINGQCWMTQNLRLTGTVSATDSNFSGSDFNVSQYSLDSTDSSYANHCNSTNGYNYACAKDSGSETTGAWYNYYAATAGTISGSSNTNPATSDICPSGWHLPSAPNTTADTDINKLVGNTTSGWQDPTPGLTAFGAVAGGYYYNGSLYSPEYGLWWSATARDATYRYRLFYDSSNGQFYGSGRDIRYNGIFLRCVKSS